MLHHLKCGISVLVESFTMDWTYAGLLVGTPNEKYNRSIYNNINPPSEWSTRNTHKFIPTLEEFRNELKPIYYRALLTSEFKNSPESDGSLLIVIWFDDLPNGRSIEEIVKQGVKDLDWKKYAEDYQD